MIEELAILFNDFPGPANQTRCFLHILNLVVKRIIQQFGLPTSKKTSNSEEDGEGNSEATKELLKLASEIEVKEEVTASGGDEADTMEDDNDEGWVDKCEEMTKDKLLELSVSIKPVRLLLTKVC